MKAKFEDKIEDAIRMMAEGKSLEEALSVFPAELRVEAKIELESAYALFITKEEIIPNKERFRDFISYLRTVPTKEVHLTSLRPKYWIFVPIGAFAVFLLVFLNIPRRSNTPGNSTQTQNGTSETQGVPSEIAALSSPIPEATGNIDDILAGMRADMGQETAAVGGEMAAAAVAASNESNTLQNFSINEPAI